MRTAFLDQEGLTGFRACLSCNQVLPLSHFYRKSDGKQGRDSRCIKCIQSYKKQFYKKRRRAKQARRGRPSTRIINLDDYRLSEVQGEQQELESVFNELLQRLLGA